MRELDKNNFAEYKGVLPPTHTHTYQTFLNGKTKKSKLCITLKGIYDRVRISLNNCEFTKFRDFASWTQKSRSGEIGQNFKVSLSI